MGKTLKNHTVDEKLTTRTVRMTNDYTKFKDLPGNRQVDKRHVNQLIRLMTENGNLTDQFPVVVDKEGYVIDGQHRLEALKVLGWEVGYIVEEAATIDTVRNINRGNKNWSWRDIAESYARLGNKEYQWFLHYYDKYDISYTLAMMFCGTKMTKRSANGMYASGEMVIPDKDQAIKFAEQYTDLREAVDITSHDFGKALNKIFHSPFYDHERMVRKMREQGHTLPIKANESDYRRDIESVFNYAYPEDNKFRLF
jgi:hypothetical protein